MNPLVSCIMPVFNGERFLREALDSIFAQTYRPIDVIVVDDGSTDGTAQAVRDTPQPVTYVRQANQGAPRARNRGLQEARGELIAFLDADDLWLPEKLQRQVDRFQARPELDFCVSHIQNFWMPEVSREEGQLQDSLRARPMPGYVTDTLVVRRRAIERIGPFDETLRHGDAAEWFLRARSGGLVGELLGEVLVHRRMHKQNTSRLVSEECRSEFLDIIKRSLDRKRSDRAGPRRP